MVVLDRCPRAAKGALPLKLPVLCRMAESPESLLRQGSLFRLEIPFEKNSLHLQQD